MMMMTSEGLNEPRWGKGRCSTRGYIEQQKEASDVDVMGIKKCWDFALKNILI